MGLIYAKQTTQEEINSKASKTNIKKGNLLGKDHAQSRYAVYHGDGSYITHGIGGGSSVKSGLREVRSFLQGEKAVVQCQTHRSFLPRSYGTAEMMYQLPFDLHRRIHEHRNQYRGEPTDSSVLRAALVDYARVPDSNDWGSDPHVDYVIRNQAHHIVEVRSEYAETARRILAQAGIDINSAANGVLLPTAGGDGRGDATLHLGGHSRAYAEYVNLALETAVLGEVPFTRRFQSKVLMRLAQIRRVLLTYPVPINANVDPNVDFAGTIEIETIFNNNGLFRPL